MPSGTRGSAILIAAFLVIASPIQATAFDAATDLAELTAAVEKLGGSVATDIEVPDGRVRVNLAGTKTSDADLARLAGLNGLKSVHDITWRVRA